MKGGNGSEVATEWRKGKKEVHHSKLYKGNVPSFPLQGLFDVAIYRFQALRVPAVGTRAKHKHIGEQTDARVYSSFPIRFALETLL